MSAETLHTRSENSEVMTNLKTLRVLIHPCFFPDGSQDEYHNSRNRLYSNIVERFAPSDVDEVTAVMLVDRENVMDIQGTEVFESLKKIGPVSENTLQIENNLYAPKLNLSDQLGEQGFILTPSTEIIFGGEYLDACILQAIGQCLEEANIRTIQIDKFATLSVAHMDGDSYEMGILFFLEDFAAEAEGQLTNVHFTEDDTYLYITKDKES